MDRVAVLFDYENVHRVGHRLFAPIGTFKHETVVDPIKLAERIVEKRNSNCVLTQIKIYRGRPVPAHQPKPASANDLQTAAWSQDPRVSVVRRDLRYDFPDDGSSDFIAREKGIDVALAIGLVEGAMLEDFDVAVVFTGDTDVLPALELVFGRTKPRIEVASWVGSKPLWFAEGLRQNPPRRLPYCHFLSEQDFKDCRDYSASGI